MKQIKDGSALCQEQAIPTQMLNLMFKQRDVPCFIVAPSGYGRSTLALRYAKAYFETQRALILDGSNESIIGGLKSGVLGEQVQLFAQIHSDNSCLLVIDDLTHLQEADAQMLSDFIDDVIEDGWAAVVIVSPLDDVFTNLQSDRLLLTAADLGEFCQPALDAQRSAIERFVTSHAYAEYSDLAGAILALGSARPAQLERLGFEVQTATIDLLCKTCPAFCYDAGIKAVVAPKLSGTDMLDIFVRAFDGRRRAFEELTRVALLLLDCDDREQAKTLFNLTNILLKAVDMQTDACDGADVADAVFDDAANGSTTADATATSAVKNDCMDISPKAQQLEARESPSATGRTTATMLSIPVSTQSMSCQAVCDVPPLIIRLFNDLEIWRGDELLFNSIFTRSKVRTLLIYLTVNLHKGMPRQTILRLLWPEMDMARALDNFYVAWSKLKTALKPKGMSQCPYLLQSSSVYKLNVEFVQSDVKVFENLSRNVLFEDRDRDTTLESIYQMERLFCDSQLTGNSRDHYLQDYQQRYRTMMVEALLVGAGIYEREDDTKNALWLARRAFDTDPCREDVYQVLMEIQSKAGQRTSAIKTYFACKQYLANELGLLPSRRTSSTFQDLLMEC